MTALITLVAYFALLFIVSTLSGHGGNDEFFRGRRQSPWFVVAFGMIGASISGVSFVSVPGMVTTIDMTYMQMCLGFFFGYLLVAFVLLPVYYKYNLTSIYSFLGMRLGRKSYTTGSAFFIISKLTGAAARLYLACLVLQRFVFDSMGVPYSLTVVVVMLLIWLYTRKSGIRSIVWTDSIQTLCMFVALVFICIRLSDALGLDFRQTCQAVYDNPHSRMFEFADWTSRQYFWKQFLSGVFIVIVMTGLDQDMMQKNLTCKNLSDAKKDMCTYGIMFIPANLVFLSLGVLLTLYYAQTGTPLPEKSDDLLSSMVATGMLGEGVLVLFTFGIVASAFSSADSAMTALTTSVCVDILRIEQKESRWSRHPETTRKAVHVVMMAIFLFCILVFKAVNNTSVIDAIYIIAGYTYGPLLGMFAFAIFTKRLTLDAAVPFVAVASPLICFAVDTLADRMLGYKFGYELLMLNGLITFAGLYAFSSRAGKPADLIINNGK